MLGGSRDQPGTAAVMRKYHHIGIPTSVPQPGEIYLRPFDTHVRTFDQSAYGIEWMRYGPHAPVPDLVRHVAHVAFEVDDLAAELAGKEILIPPNSPSAGVTVAFIVEDGAPVELLEFSNPNHKDR